MGEHAFIVDYENEESKVSAHAFHLEGLRLTPRGSPEELANKKAALITHDPQVDETDRMLSAVIAVGSQFGSREQMARIKEKESLLLKRASTFDFAAWRAELVAPKDPPSRPEPFANANEVAANINDQIRRMETGTEGPESDDNDLPLGQAPP